MSTVTFDTHAFIKKLKDSGVPEEQAEAHVEALKQAVADDLATKHDLKDLKIEIKAEIHDLRHEVQLVKWMCGLILGGVIALIVSPSLYHYAIGAVIGAAVGLCAVVLIIVVDEGGVTIGRPRRALAREVIAFGVHSQLAGATDVVLFQSGKLIAGVVLGPAAAGAYDLGIRLIHHDGGVEESLSRLPDMINGADAVICPTDCVSHSAYYQLKRHCKRSGKPCLLFKGSGISGFAAALARVSSGQTSLNQPATALAHTPSFME